MFWSLVGPKEQNANDRNVGNHRKDTWLPKNGVPTCLFVQTSQNPSKKETIPCILLLLLHTLTHIYTPSLLLSKAAHDWGNLVNLKNLLWICSRSPTPSPLFLYSLKSSSSLNIFHNFDQKIHQYIKKSSFISSLFLFHILFLQQF